MMSRLFYAMVLIPGCLLCPANHRVPQNVPPRISDHDTGCWIEAINKQFETENISTIIKSVKKLEKVLENTYFSDTRKSIIRGRLVSYIFKATGNFNGLRIIASQKEVTSESEDMANYTVKVHLPKELLESKEKRNIVFCMITSPEKYGPLGVLDGRIVGLSVSNKIVSGLHENINISMPLQNSTLYGDEEPSCHFYNFSTNKFYKDGCSTEWRRDQGDVVCSCDHLTYFAVLMVSPSISVRNQEILTYITLIGCSLSLFFLVVTVLLYLYITQRGVNTDISLKVHINLAVALILLNLHFLPNKQVAALPFSGSCVYVAVLLHYSLLATFTWTAIEGFHLYLLLVRVFNIYVRKYLLKLSLVGWGFPAVVVILIAIIDTNMYSRVTLQSSDNNGTAVKMCYLNNDTVKLVTTVGLFSLVFVFNLGMLAVSVRHILCPRVHEQQALGEKDRAMRATGTVLGITCLLGITWGIIFFSFGYLTTPGLYLFCVLNSLQGFFIFLWFCVSKWKAGDSHRGDRNPGSDTHNTNT